MITGTPPQLDRTVVVSFLLFWGHRPSADGRPTSSCLSQWWPAPFTVDGRRFATAEHWMMWRKAELFGDAAAAAAVLAADGPREAKQRGREVRGFDAAVWAEHRFDVVVAGTGHKFGAHRDLRDYLVGTGGAVLVEASPDDAVWGIGLAADHPDARTPERWPGLNLLGEALMVVRAALTADGPPPGAG